MRRWLGVQLLLERPHIRDDRLGIGVGNAIGALHQALAVLVFHAFLDGLDRGIVCQRGLHGGAGVIFHGQLLAHFGVTLAVRAVALEAALFIKGLAVGGLCGPGGQGHRRDA